MTEKLCRTCATEINEDEALNLFVNSEILCQIEKLTGLELEQTSELPCLMCVCCQTELQQANIFRQRCIDTQEILAKQILTNETHAKIIEEDQESNPITQEFSQSQTDADILSEESMSFNDDDLLDEVTAEICEKEDQRDSLDEALFDDNSKIFKDKSVKKKLNSKKNKISSKNKEKTSTVICDICGRKVGRHAVNQHLRRHYGIKESECENCDARFCTNSELNRHMRKHTGERPYACRHCHRRFTDYTSRVKHERTHTNERPFACTFCGKAFSTTYILKNHLVIHTGERSFRCEPCNKSYQLQSHLSTHYRTISHKQNVEKQNDKLKVLLGDTQ